MSDVNEAYIKHNNMYSHTPTETLEEMLRYSVFSENTLDVDEAREILSELQHRDPRPPHKTPEEAWAIFNSEYSGKESSYLHCAFEESNQTGVNFTGHRRPRKFHTRIRTAAVAAIIVTAMLVGTLTAYAFGYDLWGAVAQWSRETFGFRTKDPFKQAGETPGAGSEVDAEEYGDLQTALTRHGIMERVAPTWLPDGVKLEELKVATETSYQLYISALYTNDEQSISVIIALLYDVPATDYEKDDGEVVDYEKNGNHHYIMSNNSQCRAVWIIGNLECSISGDITKDELIMMIDSIYER